MTIVLAGVYLTKVFVSFWAEPVVLTRGLVRSAWELRGWGADRQDSWCHWPVGRPVCGWLQSSMGLPDVWLVLKWSRWCSERGITQYESCCESRCKKNPKIRLKLGS